VQVWITRSQPGADRLAAALRRQGYEVLVQPVLDIEPLSVDVPTDGFQIVIFLSEHAVRCGLPHLHPHLPHATVFAVGGRTAEVLAAAGVLARVPVTASSEGLLAMPELQQLSDSRILVVCGAAGREVLAPALAERGARVDKLVCYRRVPAGKLAAEPSVVGAIVAASGDGLEQIARLWFAVGGRPDVPLLVPSARVAEIGVELGFLNIHDCAGADIAAVLRTLNALPATGAI
jgi:uroporphyrinogen-III synthase